MSFKVILLWCIFQLAIFILGYAIGRRIGIKEGLSRGLAQMPIEMRRKLLETSTCPLCNQQLIDKVGCDKI